MSKLERPCSFIWLSFSQNWLIDPLEIIHYHQSIHLTVYLSKKSTAGFFLS